MPLATIIGATFGVGVTCFKNSLQYLAPYRKPWEHVICGTAGAYAANYIIEWEESLIQEIEDNYDKYKGSQAQS